MEANKQWGNNNKDNNKNNKRRMDTGTRMGTATHTTHIHIHIHTLLLLLLLLLTVLLLLCRVSKSWQTQRSAGTENVSSTTPICCCGRIVPMSRPKTTGTTVAWPAVAPLGGTRTTNRWSLPTTSMDTTDRSPSRPVPKSCPGSWWTPP